MLLEVLMLALVSWAGIAFSVPLLAAGGIAGLGLSFLSRVRTGGTPAMPEKKKEVRRIFVPLPPEELESPRPLLPNEMGTGFIPGITGDIASGISSGSSPWKDISDKIGNARELLPLPEYGDSNVLQRIFSGVPFLGRYAFDKLWP